MKKVFKIKLVRDGAMCFIPVPFDPRSVFGKLRAPVKVTLNGYTFASTITSMGEGPFIPLRKSNREAAGLNGDETLSVTLELDLAVRQVTLPVDLERALRTTPAALSSFEAASYTHQREAVEAVEGAKRAETRSRRIENIVEAMLARAARLVAPIKSNAKEAAKSTSEARALIGKAPGTSASKKTLVKRSAKSQTALSVAEPKSQTSRRTAAEPATPKAKAQHKQTAQQTQAAQQMQTAQRQTASPRRLNAAWHAANPMPTKPSVEQRLSWHLEHQSQCGCRPMPASLRALIH